MPAFCEQLQDYLYTYASDVIHVYDIKYNNKFDKSSCS